MAVGINQTFGDGSPSYKITYQPNTSWEWAVIPDGAEVRLRVKPRRINVFTADGKRSLVIREELL